jgi:hypothetical protein
VELDLSCNFEIKDDTISVLMSAIELNSSIKFFSVKRCGVSEEILEAVKRNIHKKIASNAD